MRVLIGASALNPGGGITTFVRTLERILCEAGHDVILVTTHSHADGCLSLAHYGKVMRYLQAIRLVRKLKPDVIINNYNAILQYILPFLPRQVKMVHVLHCDEPDFHRVASIHARLTCGWIAPSPAIAEHFQYPTTVIPHGVELGHPRQQGGSCLELSFAGVLYEHKGVRLLPSIIHELTLRGIDFHFTIIGTGPEEDWLKEQLSNDPVSFTGRIPHKDVYKQLAQTDIFVYPTHLDAFGLVIVEAMTNGAIPVVTLLNGITDTLIDNNVNGYLVPQDDVQSFCNRIESLISNSGTMREAAIQKANREFSLDVMRNHYLEYLQAL